MSETKEKKEIKETISKRTVSKRTTTGSKTTPVKNTTPQKTTTKNAATTSKSTTQKKPTTKSTDTTNKSTTSKKSTTKSTATSSKNTALKKSTTKSSATSKKSATPKKTSTRGKTTSDKAKTNKFNSTSIQPEYYDLPYRYNETTVKILAQTPHALFIYWDISDNDRNEMLHKYGEDFFYQTKPILIIHNHTLNANYEVDIDDFTNSWYFRTPTSNCVFTIELGRKKRDVSNNYINFENNSGILHIATSNTIESPNDHVLREYHGTVHFENIKTHEIQERSISNDSWNDSMYSIIGQNGNDEIYTNNPTSGF